MISATDLKNGSTFKLNGEPFRVTKYSHQKLGRGGATVKLTVKNLKSGEFSEKTMSSNARVDEINTRKTPLQFLYKDFESAYFMDPKTYDQLQISLKTIGDEVTYLKVGQSVDVLFWEDVPLSVEIPPKVILKVKNTTPGVKGNSATNVFKPALLENGLTVKVPLFIGKGDMVKVDTRTNEYVERAKLGV